MRQAGLDLGGWDMCPFVALISIELGLEYTSSVSAGNR